MDFKSLQADPAAFRRALLIDTDGKARRLGTVLDPWQQTDFQALDPAWRRVVGQDAEGPTRAYLERPRGHSKTLDLAVMATWALFASRRKLRGYAAAADQDQARLLRDAIDGLVRLNPWLRQILQVDKAKVANSRTGSSLDILTSDAPTSYGLTPDFLIVDELTHWPKRDLWDSLISSSAKRAVCVVVCIANAGFKDSWVWETRETIRRDADWYFSRLDGPRASWITAERLEEQRRLLPAIAFNRLWLNQWTSGSGDALDPDDIDRAVTLKGPITKGKRGWRFYAGLDLGLSRDKAALAVIGRHVGYSQEIAPPTRPLSDRQRLLIEAGVMEAPEEPEPTYISHNATGRIRLAQLHVWTPPANGKVSIEEIEETIAQLDSRFRLQVGCDPWQAAYLIERLQKRNVTIEAVDFLGANLKSMCSATLEAFNEGLIQLYDEPQLLADLKALRVEERIYGCRLVSPRGPNGHGDSATALSIALHVARAKTLFENQAPTGKLVVY